MTGDYPPVSIGYAALRGRCPRCGRGKLYKSLLDVADACGFCQLSFTQHEQGDGPAFFAILVMGGLTAIFAAILEIKFEPPLWTYAAVAPPFVVVGSIMFLRWFKAALIAIQYQLRQEDFKS